MAQKFVLGPNAARAVRQLMNGTGTVGSRPSAGAAVVADLDYVPPFTVKWAASANDGAGSWIIWIPSNGCLMVGGAPVDIISGLEDVGGDYPSGWYVLDCLEEAASRLYLNVYIPKEEDDSEDLDDESASSDDEEPVEVTAEFSAEEGASEGDEDVWPITVCTMSGKNVAQTVMSAISIGGDSGAGGSVETDDVSVDLSEDSELELAHFADGEKDSGKGLACRLKADTETGEITASDSDDSLMLVCRKGGEIIYVPIGGSASATDPDSEDEKQPCQHPTDGNSSGGIDPDDDISGEGGGGGGSGGVEIGDTDTAHPGDSDCNCNQ